jgi:hypothetical protein
MGFDLGGRLILGGAALSSAAVTVPFEETPSAAEGHLMGKHFSTICERLG